MTTGLYLSRARLRREVSDAALRELLGSFKDSARATAGHHLVWTLFGDAPDRARDFLWREVEPGHFYCLSARAPADRRGLFELDPPKPFTPALTTGDRLAFALRVNATVARSGGGSQRGKPCDVVMDALHGLPPRDRAAARARVMPEVAYEWLAARGERCGFALPASSLPQNGDAEDERRWPVRVLGYRVLRIDRGRGAAPLRVGVLDLEGTLEVREPATFVAALGRGFGRAKAFGCGLMLVRRAPPPRRRPGE